ncbi:MAG: hypothetical protein ABI197_00720 [Granulicella sp.]
MMTNFDPTRLLGPFVAIMVVILIFGSRLTPGRMKETPEGLVFSLKPIYALSRLLFLPIYMAFFFWMAWRQNHAMPWAILLLCLIVYVLSMLQIPATIILTPMTVTQHFWLQRTKTIPYGEVTSLHAMQAGRAILVLGENRARIRHSANHSAAADFRREIERRTGKRVIT